MKILLTIFIVLIFVFGSAFWLFGPVEMKSEPVIFTVPKEKIDFDVAQNLLDQRLIRSAWGFEFLYSILAKGKEIQSGGYRLNKNMFAWQVLVKLTDKPDLLWVTIAGCQRKEQIGETLATLLNWDDNTLKEWNAYILDGKPEYKEGVFYPDTYLIPVDESGAQVAKRFIDRFNEKFAPLAQAFSNKNIKWTTGLKIASLIAREAGGQADMKLISGIIWNRLDGDIKLQIDATMQYTLGQKSDGSWWGGIDLTQKQSDSPYNTYVYKGLPPTPICSPGIEAIEAVIKPDATDCIFYLHDHDKQIHCAKTYEGHKVNIRTYLQ